MHPRMIYGESMPLGLISNILVQTLIFKYATFIYLFKDNCFTDEH